MKNLFTLLLALLCVTNLGAQSLSSAYKVKKLEGEAVLVVNNTHKQLSVGDIVGISDTIKLQNGSKLTILQMEKPNKVFEYVDKEPSTVYHIIKSSNEKSTSVFRELCKAVIRHSKKEDEARLEGTEKVLIDSF